MASAVTLLSADHDSNEVGRQQGKFKRLKLLVRGNGIDLNRITVMFADGEVERIKFNERIRAGGESRPIDLRTEWREGRSIREVELRYRSRPGKRASRQVRLSSSQDRPGKG